LLGSAWQIAFLQILQPVAAELRKKQICQTVSDYFLSRQCLENAGDSKNRGHPMGSFRRLFGKNKAEEASQPLEVEESTGILTVNTDNLTREGRQAIWEEIGKTTNLPIFEGKVEHGYSRFGVSETARCPRCHAETRQHYANFIYATDITQRVMFAPAGFFCSACPTVIIDEEMISGGVMGGFLFQGVVGIDYDKKKESDFFRTWNGKKSVYILDEDQKVMGLKSVDENEAHQGVSHLSEKSKGKQKKKRHMAKKARRRNRKK